MTGARSELALKLKPVIAEKAKENQASHTEQGYQKSDKAVDTKKELARAAGSRARAFTEICKPCEYTEEARLINGVSALHRASIEGRKGHRAT